MKSGGLGSAGRELRTLFEGGSTAALSDGQLLARFSSGRGDASAEAAFAALVARHGPMVWGTCRRILRDPHAAEDAFQATFLILVRKAGSVRVEDSLGRWLHGVGVRVALRAKAVEARRRGGDLSGLEPSVPALEPDLDGLRSAIDEEVDRLPSSYRSVVVLCHLEGLTRERAASRLGCPVGTVNSRLSRAGELLRSRLTRRGLAPASGALAAWLASSEGTARASLAVSPNLVDATTASAMAIIPGAAMAGSVPAGVAALWKATLRSMTMMTWMKTLALGATLLTMAAFATVAGRAAWQEGGQAPRGPAEGQKAEPVTERTRPQTPSEQFQAILAEWLAVKKGQQDAYIAAKAQAKTGAERDEIAKAKEPDMQAYFRRCLELAEVAPRDPGSRDALVWVAVSTPSLRVGGWPSSPLSVQKRTAIERLLRHHAGDPAAIRVVQNFTNLVSRDADAVVRSFFDRAEGREAKGIATLAMAQYLDKKAAAAAFAAGKAVQPNAKILSYNEQGRPVQTEGPKSFDDAYWEHLRASDAQAIRRESDDLFRRVINEYADVPYESANSGFWPKQVPARPARTLGEMAEAHYQLAFGQTAPEIVGIDLDGRPLKLSDHRGKVVLVVFWNSSSVPAMAQVPHLKELAERHEGKPFLLLGVNNDADPDAARKAARDAGMTWPSWADGAPHHGPIANRYLIRGIGTPTFLVVDAKGAIRSKSLTPLGVDQLVDKLLAEIEPAK